MDLKEISRLLADGIESRVLWKTPVFMKRKMIIYLSDLSDTDYMSRVRMIPFNPKEYTGKKEKSEKKNIE